MRYTRIFIGLFAWVALWLFGALVTLCAAAAADADVVGVISEANGMMVMHHDQGVCVKDARRAEYISTETKEVLPGCWVIRGNVVAFAFFDGRSARPPLSAVQRQEGAPA